MRDRDTEFIKSCLRRGIGVSCCPQVGWVLPCIQLGAQGLQAICWCCPAPSLWGWWTWLWKHTVSHPKSFTDTWLVIPHGASNTSRGKTVMQGCVECVVNDVTWWALISPYHLWSHIPAMPEGLRWAKKTAGRSRVMCQACPMDYDFGCFCFLLSQLW